MSANAPYRGVFTIPSTPFHPTGEADEDGLRRIVEFCIECGAHGLVYPVNASEFIALTDAERMFLSEVVVGQNDGRLPVIVGVQGVTREAAVEFATHGREIGADGVIAMPPYLRRGALSEDVITDYYRAVAEAADMTVFIQNNMPPIGSDLSAACMLDLCREIEHVEYIKEETVPTTVKLSGIVDADAEGACLGVFGGGGGRYLIEEHRRGVAGQMPGCHMTDVVVALWDALEAGDGEQATRIYKEMAPLFFFEHQLPGCYKEVLCRRSVIDSPTKRNGPMPLDDIASAYLDEILAALEPLMTWSRP